MKRRAFLQSAIAAAATAAIPQHHLLAALYQPLRPDVPDIPAVTGDGREVTLRGQDIAELGARLRGQLLLAGDDGYEDARQILNPSFDKRPALIARVAGAADVRAAVDFARDHGGLLLAVKCGGHSFSGASTCDRGMMIDLSPFRNVRVDPAARRAWVTGGSLLGHVDYETMAYGLVAPFGTVSHTGVGGLVTQGGFGRLGRRFGLSIDNLESVQVVTADGRLLHASAEENEDLFWGVRGGGGNFGVVTNFEFRLHPLQQQVVGGRIMFPLEVARDALDMYAEYGAEMPDELYTDLSVTLPPGGQPGVVGFSVCHSGRAGDAEKALAPIRALGKPLSDDIKTVDYVALQRSGDIDDPRATGIYLKSGFLTSLSPALAEIIAGGLEGHPERVTRVAFQHSGGAIGRVDPLATAFAQRDAKYNMLGITGWPHGPDANAHMDYMRDFWQDVEPHTHGFYTADMVPDIGQEQIRANYRANHERLVAVKNRYDPTNLFRLNANVKPTVKA